MVRQVLEDLRVVVIEAETYEAGAHPLRVFRREVSRLLKQGLYQVLRTRPVGPATNLVFVTLILDAADHRHARSLISVDRLARLDPFHDLALRERDPRFEPRVVENERRSQVDPFEVDGNDHSANRAIVDAPTRRAWAASLVDLRATGRVGLVDLGAARRVGLFDISTARGVGLLIFLPLLRASPSLAGLSRSAASLPPSPPR